MPTDDREEQFERALARHLRNASPDSACPDAEILAAYHERTLSLEEMARWKEHIAGCTHCQESLAQLEQTENLPAEEWEHQNVPLPVEEMAMPTKLRAVRQRVQQSEEEMLATPTAAAMSAPAMSKVPVRAKWRWIVPVGALAASVIVWVGVREVRMQEAKQMASVQVAQNRQEAPKPSAMDYEITDQLKKQEAPAKRLEETAPVQKAMPAPMSKLVAPSEPGATARASAPAITGSETVITKQKDQGIIGGTLQAPPRPTAPAAGYAAKSRASESLAAPPANTPAPAGTAAANRTVQEQKEEMPRSTSQSVEVVAAAPVVTTDSANLKTPGTGKVPIAVRNVADLMRVAAGDRSYIVAPGEKHAWRVGVAGRIERSTDGGKSWKMEKSDVTADLTAGSATSDKVCWVVGRSGTILLTTDGGKHWKLISSPITEDLGGIHATDALHASIWDVANRKSYETSDGGVSWKRTANE